jgi:hypothetical protein
MQDSRTASIGANKNRFDSATTRSNLASVGRDIRTHLVSETLHSFTQDNVQAHDAFHYFKLP